MCLIVSIELSRSQTRKITSSVVRINSFAFSSTASFRRYVRTASRARRHVSLLFSKFLSSSDVMIELINRTECLQVSQLLSIKRFNRSVCSGSASPMMCPRQSSLFFAIGMFSEGEFIPNEGWIGPLERREERGSSLFSSPAKISLSATTLSVSWKIKKLLLRSVLHRFISSSSVGYEEMINERARSADWQVGMKYEVKSEDSCIFAASSSIARTKRSTRDSESSLNSFNPSLGCRSAKYEAK